MIEGKPFILEGEISFRSRSATAKDFRRDESFHQSERLIEGTRIRPSGGGGAGGQAVDTSESGMPEILENLKRMGIIIPGVNDGEEDQST